MAIDLTPSGASGSGPQTLTLKMGRNTTRANKTYSFTLKGTGSYSTAPQDTLTVTQGYAALAINATTTAYHAYYSANAQTVLLEGTANGKYLKYQIVTSGVTMSSATESSGSSATAVGTSYAQVNNFLGGSQVYGFAMNVTVPANTTPGTYTVRMYTCDNTSGTGELYTDYTITVHHTMVIDGVSAIATTDNYSDYGVVYSPEKSTDTACQWTLTDPDNVASLSSNGDGTYRLTITDTTANNKTVTLSAVNTADSHITATKSVTLTYTSAAVDAPFVVYVNGVESYSLSVNSQETNDYTPEIILRANPAVAITDLSIPSVDRTGILALGAGTAALSSKSHKIWTTFTENTTASDRTGSLTITYGSGSETYSKIVSYTQKAKSADLALTSMEILPNSFSILENQSTGALTATVTVKFINDNTQNSYQFKGINGKFFGYDEASASASDKTEIFNKNISGSQITDVTVAASSYETRTYTETWTPTYPSGMDFDDVKRVEVSVWAGTKHFVNTGYATGLDPEVL